VTTEDDFQKALDANPEDWQTRLVFADWFQERNDPRAEGYRALGINRMHPLQDLRPNTTHNWYFHSSLSDVMRHHPKIATLVNLLPADWFELVRTGKFNTYNGTLWLWVGYSTARREVEDAVALSFGQLPANRRAELMAGVPHEANLPTNNEPKKNRRARTRREEGKQ
jgi:uncharacterized protein (TIGR02996 family)